MLADRPSASTSKLTCDSEKPRINDTKYRQLETLESCLVEYDQLFLIGHSLDAGLLIHCGARNQYKCLGISLD